MAVADAIAFGPFRLEHTQNTLWRENQAVTLQPRPLAVLRYLVEHPGQVVSKAELLKEVWTGTVVSKTTLKVCIRTVREALGDDTAAPRYIETVGREGYRFIAPLAASTAPVASSKFRHSALNPQHPVLVGRKAELTQFHFWLDTARRGERQLVFVTGEAGIGKTTLVDMFLADVRQQETSDNDWTIGDQSPTSGLWFGRGQCVEQRGTGEAYLPMLEALGRLGREREGGRLLEVLRQYAPTWLAQLPALVSEAEVGVFQRKAADRTRERMLRELAEAMEALTAEQPLVLVLEDLHWSDVSTLELLAYLAQRREQARLLILGTYRPTDVIVQEHPLRGIKQGLQARGQCKELALELLTRDEIARYVAGCVRSEAIAPELAQWIYQRTEGNALFMVNVVEQLLAQELIAEENGQWNLKTGTEGVEEKVPENLRQLIEKQVERLSLEQRQMLEIASVVGVTFAVATVAAGLKREIEDIEEICEDLAWQGYFLEESGVAEWPDGTASGQYSFRHALYQNVLYERIPEARRMRVHRALGVRVESGYGERAAERAAELAVHFANGRDYHKALQYRLQAADNALGRDAHHEATDHFLKGLELLTTQPETTERRQQELRLQRRLGASLMATKGFAAPEVEKTCARLRELCQQLGDTRQLGLVLPLLRGFHFARGEMQTARALAEQFLTVARHTQRPFLLLTAHSMLGETLLSCGEFAATREHLEQGLAVYDPQQSPSSLTSARSVPHPSVCCLANLAATLWYTGYPDRALEKIRHAVVVAQDLSRPASLAYALDVAAFLHQMRREPQQLREHVEAVLTIAHEYGFPFWEARCSVLQGWALAEQGEGERGIAQICQGLAFYRRSGVKVGPIAYLASLAEAYGKVGQSEDGLVVATDALAAAETNRECCWQAELYRLKGELTLAQSSVRRLESSVQKEAKGCFLKAKEAKGCFLKAIEVAQRQHAKAWELRATVSLARLRQHQATQPGSRTTQHETRAKLDTARTLLSDIYHWFTEGFDTRDLQEARALLDELA